MNKVERILVTILFLLTIQSIFANTYYYKLIKKIDGDNIYTNTRGGQFITIEDALNYNDVMEKVDNEYIPVDELVKSYRVFKHKRRFCRLVERIRSGRIRLKQITEKQFLQDKELLKEPIDRYDYSVGWEETKRNLEKIIIFLITQIIGTAIVFGFFKPNFWAELIMNLFVVLSAIFSGFLSAQQNIKLKTAIYEHRNAFLRKNLDLDEEFTPQIIEKK